MESTSDVFFKLRNGIDVVPLEGGDLLLRSDSLAIRVEGSFARILHDRVLPLLDGSTPFQRVRSQLNDLPADQLRTKLEELCDAGVLQRSTVPQAIELETGASHAPLWTILESLGVPESHARKRLGSLRVGVFGLEGIGGHVAIELARCGMGTLSLIDPYPCRAGNLPLMGLVAPDSLGKARDEVISAVISERWPGTNVHRSSFQEVTRDAIRSASEGCHLLVSCWDRGFMSANHWSNRAAVELRVPAVFAESRGHRVYAGPFVLPGQTACYMCYRMRAVACEEELKEAMAYEAFLDARKRTELDRRAVMPPALSWAAALLALDCLRFLVLSMPPSLGGRVLELNTLDLETTAHPLLQQPACPVCQKKNPRRRHHPSARWLSRDHMPQTDLLQCIPRLISAHCGVVKNAHLFAKDVTEPKLPHVWRTMLANHRLTDQDLPEHRMSSGKGFTTEDSQTSAFGESVERYSSAFWDPREVTFGRRGDLTGRSLNPRHLVLYTPEQYSTIKYAPYREDTMLGWIEAKSLVHDCRIWVPALAVFMGYEVYHAEEFICPVTSNGLAAGGSPVAAVLSAALEVIERDSFTITWLNQLPVERWDVTTHPDVGMVELCEAYRARGASTHLLRLPTDQPCAVFMAIIVQDEEPRLPAAVVGLGADFDLARAARKAVLEAAQIRPGLRRRLRSSEAKRRLEELVCDPRQVTSLDDHDLLYASPAALPKLEFLLRAERVSSNWPVDPAPTRRDQLLTLVKHLREHGQDLIYCNLTPADMARLGLFTARAIMPEFQPIDFGWQERRLGGTRLYELPVTLGLRGSRHTADTVNPDPHPIA